MITNGPRVDGCPKTKPTLSTSSVSPDVTIPDGPRIDGWPITKPTLGTSSVTVYLGTNSMIMAAYETVRNAFCQLRPKRPGYARSRHGGRQASPFLQEQESPERRIYDYQHYCGLWLDLHHQCRP
ncbi:hypothetical protein LTS10_008825 [Elasticomyces elasticus]|nr:hypothetical protein LTS10_008825 [Elasticomyces elasticus]